MNPMTSAKPSISFDYETLPRCEYPVPDDSPDYEGDCSEAAVARGYWMNEATDWINESADREDSYLHLCEKHLALVIQQDGERAGKRIEEQEAKS